MFYYKTFFQLCQDIEGSHGEIKFIFPCLDLLCGTAKPGQKSDVFKIANYSLFLKGFCYLIKTDALREFDHHRRSISPRRCKKCYIIMSKYGKEYGRDYQKKPATARVLLFHWSDLSLSL